MVEVSALGESQAPAECNRNKASDSRPINASIDHGKLSSLV